VRVAPCGAFIGADGRPADRVFALGPLRFGTLFETTAMPEVRTQARDLAGTLEALLGEHAPGTRFAGEDAVASAI
jgi:hydroxyacylglutathione hydrolase